MLLCRRDLEYIIKVMDKFDRKQAFDGVTLDYKQGTGSYELSIAFTHRINGVVCRMTIDIEDDMFGECDE
jgi:hypothetical protein